MKHSRGSCHSTPDAWDPPVIQHSWGACSSMVASHPLISFHIPPHHSTADTQVTACSWRAMSVLWSCGVCCGSSVLGPATLHPPNPLWVNTTSTPTPTSSPFNSTYTLLCTILFILFIYFHSSQLVMSLRHVGCLYVCMCVCLVLLAPAPYPSSLSPLSSLLRFMRMPSASACWVGG